MFLIKYWNALKPQREKRKPALVESSVMILEVPNLTIFLDKKVESLMLDIKVFDLSCAGFPEFTAQQISVISCQ